MSEMKEYRIRANQKLPYNDGKRRRLAVAGDIVTLPQHLAEGEFAPILETLDGKPIDRTRFSLAEIDKFQPHEQIEMLEKRREASKREQAEIDARIDEARRAADDQAQAREARRQDMAGDAPAAEAAPERANVQEITG